MKSLDSNRILSVENKLNVYFAALACLCAMTFIGVPDLESLPVVAVFFALFGLIFVDLLKWFALPPWMAYLALGGIALNTIKGFVAGDSGPSEPQMLVVANLLIHVQAVLMLQRKNRRIYEQLAVFALLELIVAAIFNNALAYGVLLLPVCFVTMGALTMLHVHTTASEAFQRRSLADNGMRVTAQDAQQSFSSSGSRLPFLSFFSIAPAIALVAFVFFYALPRTSQNARRGLGGAAQVGFNSEVKLGQIGNMLTNPEIAVKIEMNDRRRRSRYNVVGDFYLRGAVLESYNHGGNLDGSWGTVEGGQIMAPRQLPPDLVTSFENRQRQNDEVLVRLSVAPMRSNALFSLPPYHYGEVEVDIVHRMDRWAIERRQSSLTARESQINYRFVSRGFREGIQDRYLPRFASSEQAMEADELERYLDSLEEPEADELESQPVAEAADATQQSGSEQRRRRKRSAVTLDREQERNALETLRMDYKRSADDYRELCLQYEPDLVPTAELLAQTLVDELPKESRNPISIAVAMESYLASGTDYKYTLNLTREEVIGMDPTEQFLSRDREGNCQYFASALALMLRSQKIPSRLVVGFNTDEYNNLSGQYIARQLHAHAWVEALVSKQWVPEFQRDNSVQADEYWVRLDPTPGGGGGTSPTVTPAVTNVLDLAQDIWTSYVVETDANSRRQDGLNSTGISSSYQMFYERLKLQISRIRAGDLGAGSLAGREWFAWPIALGTMAFFSIGLIGYQFGLRRWIRKGDDAAAEDEVQTPSIPFFAEAVALLGRVGCIRKRGQTPWEFMTVSGLQLDGSASVVNGSRSAGNEPEQAAEELGKGMVISDKRTDLAEPLQRLTSAFYSQRFGRGASAITSPEDPFAIQAALDSVRKRVDQELASKVR